MCDEGVADAESGAACALAACGEGASPARPASSRRGQTRHWHAGDEPGCQNRLSVDHRHSSRVAVLSDAARNCGCRIAGDPDAAP